MCLQHVDSVYTLINQLDELVCDETQEHTLRFTRHTQSHQAVQTQSGTRSGPFIHSHR